ncbi:ABC transporter ATP-binding protein YvcR [Bacillus cereus]|nr:ABC transporter ATP-binding protein YvcR [Bacillus cereus]
MKWNFNKSVILLEKYGCMKEEALAKIRLNEIGFIFQQSNLLK